MMIDLFGSSDFCLPTAEALRATGYELRLVTTLPPSGHKSRVQHQNPVQQYAITHQLPITGIRTTQELKRLYQLWEPPVCAIVASFGRIIPQAVLISPTSGFLNIHPSLLPRHRGPSPVQSTILSGDERTGVTIIVLDAEVDHGPIIAIQETDVAPNETAPELKQRLSVMGSELLLTVLKPWIDGSIQPTPQNHNAATMSRKIHKEDGRILWSQSAETIQRQWRACSPWPGTWTTLLTPEGGHEIIKLFDIQPVNERTDRPNPAPGTILDLNSQHQLIIQAGSQSTIACSSIQRSSKKRMTVGAFIQGFPDLVGRRFE